MEKQRQSTAQRAQAQANRDARQQQTTAGHNRQATGAGPRATTGQDTQKKGTKGDT